MTRPAIDYTHKDAAALTRALLDLASERLPVWRDRSPNDLGVVLLEAFAYMGDLLLYYQDRIANESYLHTAVEPRSVVNLLRLIGYELEPSKPASVDLSLLFDPSAPAQQTIRSGTEFQTTRESAGAVITFRYLGPDLDIDLVADEAVQWPRDDPAYLRWDGTKAGRKLSVQQVDREVTDEIVGSSDGSAGQRFTLAGTPVIDDSVTVQVIEGGIESAWARVDALLDSQPLDHHYQVRRDENERVWIELGNGIQGRIPPRGVNNLRARYRVGGGARGNVAKNSIVKPGRLADALVGLRASMHDEPASGGADREALDVAAQRAPLQFRSQDRAVTADDYVAHVRELGIPKARAFEGPWNRVQIYVAPAGGGMPSAALIEEVRRHLDAKRVMTTVVDVHPPEYVAVDITISLDVEPTFFAADVEQAVRDAVTDLLSFDRVDFEQTLYISKFYEVVEAVDGVRGVIINFASSSEGLIQLEAKQIPRRGQLTVTTTGGVA